MAAKGELEMREKMCITDEGGESECTARVSAIAEV